MVVKTVILITVLSCIFFPSFCSRRPRKWCDEGSLKIRIESASFVFIGKVKRIYRLKGVNVYIASVKVQHVFKGSDSYLDHFIMVRGLGNPSFCRAKPRVDDTRLFLVKEVCKGEFHITSSLMKLTQKNLMKYHHFVLPGKFKMSFFFCTGILIFDFKEDF